MDPPTDPRDGAADRLGSDPPPAGLAPAGPVVPGAAAVPFPKCGQLWHHYRLTDEIPGGPGQGFHAIDMEEYVSVVVRVSPVGPETEARRAAWTVLKGLREPWMAELKEAQEEDGLRYEVSRLPLPLTLRDWRAHRQVGLPDFEVLVRQLTNIVAALHSRGLVHLNLRPDTLHVVSAEGELQVYLGGLDYATMFEQAQPFAVPVNPLYAPPEAVGLEMQPPGRALCSWDWWSMGRVVQEFVMGRHIYGDLLQCDFSKEVAVFRAEAEVLLTETGDYRVRAGAVELMPAMYDSQISLLRGLLASVRLGRWGFREVQRWLEHKPVKDRYDCPRDERFFVRPDGVHTVPEVAEFFSEEANWAEGEANLFNADDPASFAHFIGTDAGNYDLLTQLKGFLDLGGIAEWRDLPRTAMRSVLSGIVWSALAGPKTGLQVRGRRITHHELLLLMREEGDGPAMGRALLAPAYLRKLQETDPETASVLSEIASEHTAMLAKVVKNGWMTTGDEAATRRILTLCMEAPHVLADALGRLRANFACTRDPAAKALLALAAKDRGAQILLAYADSCPERFGFVTQETLDREQYDGIRRESLRMAAALFWLRLREALASNPLVFGSWTVVVPTWLGLAGLAWLTGLHHEAHGGFVLLLAIPLILRLVHWSRMGRLVRDYAMQGQPWRWRDGVGRCRKELLAALPGADARSPDSLVRQLGEMNWKMTEIPLKQAPQLVSIPGWLPGLWTTSMTSWLIMVVVFCSATNEGIKRVRASGWTLSVRSVLAGTEETDPNARRPVTDWSFGDPRRRQIDWDLPRPAIVPGLGVEKIIAATPDQIAYALVEGEREVMPYRRRTVEPLIAVRVPTKSGVDFIVFDSRDGAVAERRIFRVDRLPPVRSWFELDRYLVVYLGASKPEIDSRQSEPAEVLPVVP